MRVKMLSNTSYFIEFLRLPFDQFPPSICFPKNLTTQNNELQDKDNRSIFCSLKQNRQQKIIISEHFVSLSLSSFMHENMFTVRLIQTILHTRDGRMIMVTNDSIIRKSCFVVSTPFVISCFCDD